jgi:hypothetical protein
MSEPLHPSVINEIKTSEGPEDPEEAKTIKKVAGFPYYTSISNIIFAYMIFRLYIGCAVTELSTFSTCLAPIHYTALTWVFMLPAENSRLWYGVLLSHAADPLPHTPFKLLHPTDPVDVGLPYPNLVTIQCAYVDTPHANYLYTHHSTGVCVFCLTCITIAYHTK